MGRGGGGGWGIENSSKLNKWWSWTIPENSIAGVGWRIFISNVEIEQEEAEVFWVAISL